MTVQISNQSNAANAANAANVNPNIPTKKFKLVRKSKKPNNQSQTPTDQQQPILSTNEKKFKFKRKHKLPSYNRLQQYSQFVSLCNKHNLPYFQFFDEDNWKGPVIKVCQNEFDHVFDIFDAVQPYLRTIILNGYGFAIIRPVDSLDDSDVQYNEQHCEQCKFTNEPMIPYNSDQEDDADYDAETDYESDEEIIVEEEFVAEEWIYNRVTYLLDTTTNYIYSPDTLEFMGKKTGDFSVDFNAKER
jgi:hypothetical protein